MYVVQIKDTGFRKKFHTRKAYRKWLLGSIRMFSRIATKPIYLVWHNGSIFSINPWKI